MSEHTPGPWHVDGRMVAVSPIVSVCAMVDFDSFGGIQNAHNWEANARLIAAAPDLLEMLKVAQLWLDADGRFDMQGINAAIAKAEGRA